MIDNPKKITIDARESAAEIIARHTGHMPKRQTTIGGGLTVQVSMHTLHEAVYHAVTINRPTGMTKTAAHQLASRVAESALGMVWDESGAAEAIPAPEDVAAVNDKINEVWPGGTVLRGTDSDTDDVRVRGPGRRP